MWYYYESAKLVGDAYVTSASCNWNGIFIVTRSGLNNARLSTVYPDVFGIFYTDYLWRCSATSRPAAADNITIATMEALVESPIGHWQSQQYVNVYRVAFPGQEQKPYDARLSSRSSKRLAPLTGQRSCSKRTWSIWLEPSSRCTATG